MDIVGSCVDKLAGGLKAALGLALHLPVDLITIRLSDARQTVVAGGWLEDISWLCRPGPRGVSRNPGTCSRK